MRPNPHRIGPREEKGEKENMKKRGVHTVLFSLFFPLVDSLKITNSCFEFLENFNVSSPFLIRVADKEFVCA
jgi:hypothetical protein